MKDKSNHLQMLFYTDLIEYNPPSLLQGVPSTILGLN